MKSHTFHFPITPWGYLIALPEKTEKVYIDIFYRRGHVFDPSAFKGMTHVLEHYLISSIKKKNAGHDLDMGGIVENESSMFSLTTDKENMFRDLSVFLNGMLRADFSDEELFLSELSVIRSEIVEKNNNSDVRIYNEISRSLFSDDCPYAVTDISTIGELEKFNLDTVAEFYRNEFVVSEPMITIGAWGLGKEEIKELQGIINKQHLRFKKSFASFEFPVYPFPPAHTAEIENDAVREGIRAIFVFPGLSFRDSDNASRIAWGILAKTIESYSPFGLGEKIRRVGIYGVNADNIIGESMGTATLDVFVQDEDQLASLKKIVKDYLSVLSQELIDEKYLDKCVADTRAWDHEAWESNEGRYDAMRRALSILEPFPKGPDYRETYFRQINPTLLRDITGKIYNLDNAVLFLVKGNTPSR